jgi:hypothetical protein
VGVEGHVKEFIGQVALKVKESFKSRNKNLLGT